MPLAMEAEYSIQVGDLGLDYSYLDRLQLDVTRHRAIAGNHDNYGENGCLTDPLFLGDYGVHEVDGASIFFVRGAWSIDQEHRKRRQKWPANIGEITWWEDEELSRFQMESAIELFRERTPEIVVSHEAPMGIVDRFTNLSFPRNFGYHEGVIATRTNQGLQAMWESHRPKLWIFGHYHCRWEETIEGTHFICLDMLRGDDNIQSYYDFKGF